MGGMVFSLLMLRFEREKTPAQTVLYCLYLYFGGLSFRDVSYVLEPFVRRSHMAVWKWVQRYEPHGVFKVKLGASEACV